MPSLTSKKIKRHRYYYARFCRRVNGKPKIVRTVYLGTPQAICQAVENTQLPPDPSSVDIATFGDCAALYSIAEQLDLVPLLDEHIPKRKQGLSVGQYLLLATINRACHPTSKLKFRSWYQTTSLSHWIPASQKELSSSAFWNHMDLVEESHIQAIEKILSERLVERFKLSLRSLVYDGTNFFSYINTRNPAKLPKLGHNKQKRNDLRQVNLGLLVSTDFHVPLFHCIYEGNINDSTQFKTISEELNKRYVELARSCQHITLIFDKGNNSKEAFQTLDQSGFHFVGSLVPSQYLDLLAIPHSQFHALPEKRLGKTVAFRTRKTVFGKDRTIVVTINPKLRDGQLQGITNHLVKTRKKLRKIKNDLIKRAKGLIKGGKAPTVASVQAKVREILKVQFMKALVRTSITEKKGKPRLCFHTDSQALAKLIEKNLGKNILFTDNDDWKDEEIILAYRAQHHIETAFRNMKNPHFLRWSPMYHWKDSKIRVHAFYCVLALTLTSLIQRTLSQKGISWSIPKIMETLQGIHECLVIYPPKAGARKSRVASTWSTLTEAQQTLWDALELQNLAPKK